MFHKKEAYRRNPPAAWIHFPDDNFGTGNVFRGLGGLGFGEMFGRMISFEESMSSDTLGVFFFLNFETFFKKSVRYGQA